MWNIQACKLHIPNLKPKLHDGDPQFQTSLADDLGLPRSAHFFQLLPEVSLADATSYLGFGHNSLVQKS